MKQPLSPTAEAVLAAITQQQYSLDPGDIPNEAGRMACIAAVALRAAVDQVVPEDNTPGSEMQYIRDELLAIAAELES